MLGSVSSVAEAHILLRGKADIVDIKDPSTGILGAATYKTIAAIVQAVNQQTKTSATVGDIATHSMDLLSAILNTTETGVDYIKVGLFGRRLPATFSDAIVTACRRNIKIVIVFFAEYYPSQRILTRLIDQGIKGIMLDTCHKDRGSLRERLPLHRLDQFVQYGKKRGVLTGLAGTLGMQDIRPLSALRPDYLGFRGALCNEQNRENLIDEDKVHAIRKGLDTINTYLNQTEVYHGKMA